MSQTTTASDPLRRINLSRRAVLFATAALSGCASQLALQVTQSGPKAREPYLRAGRLQVYSFLDLRSGFFGPKLVASFNRQLPPALTAAGVPTQLHAFADSGEVAGPSASAFSTSVPIGRVIQGNLARERAFGATHRLLVFPQSTDTVLLAPGQFVNPNGPRGFELRVDVRDVQQNSLLWVTLAKGSIANALQNDENPDGRALQLIETIVSTMRSNNLL